MGSGKQPNIGQNVSIEDVTYSIFNNVGDQCVLEHVVMGKYSYIEPNGMMQNTILKNYVDIARNVRIGATQHPLQRPTTHHVTYRRAMYGFGEDELTFFKQREEKKTIIGNDVWIGHGAIIQAGVQVGDGAVIGSNAVVTKNVPPYAIVGGVPATVIRFRFSQDRIDKLCDIAWWDWEEDLFRQRFDDFYLPIDTFISKHWKG